MRAAYCMETQNIREAPGGGVGVVRGRGGGGGGGLTGGMPRSSLAATRTQGMEFPEAVATVSSKSRAS